MTIDEAWQVAARLGKAYETYAAIFQRCMNEFKLTIEHHPTPFPSLKDIEVNGPNATLNFAGEDFQFHLSITKNCDRQFMGVIELLRKRRDGELTPNGIQWVRCESLNFDRHSHTSLKDEHGNALNLADDAATVAAWLAWLGKGAVQKLR